MRFHGMILARRESRSKGVLLDFKGRKVYILRAFPQTREKMFGNIGLPELMVIMTIALLVFGPKKLPEVGRTIGKAIREFKKSTDEIKDKFEEQIRAEDFKSLQDDLKKDLREVDIRKDLIEDGEDKKNA
jgi:TatA/E family protein of Tat protein translocase